jgi:hypothetical protein
MEVGVNLVVIFVVLIFNQVAAGYPVLCGVKTYPDEHPDWGHVT